VRRPPRRARHSVRNTVPAVPSAHLGRFGSLARRRPSPRTVTLTRSVPAHTPDIAIVIPAFNAAPWIADTVRSAVAQHDVSTEIILVDDGSEDDTVRVAVEAADGTPLQVIRQQQQGASAARNAGTRSTTARFIQYLDADDLLEPGTLGLRRAALESTGADVAYCDWARWTLQADGTFSLGEVVADTLGDRADLALFTDRWWPPCALLYRRELVHRIGPWRDDLPVIQDARFQLDAALSGARFAHVPGLGARYRVHGPASLSRRDPLAFSDDCLRNARDLHQRWLAAGTLDAGRRAALIRVYGQLARAFFPLDRARFTDVLNTLRALEPAYLPASPASLRMLSRLIGYEQAEQVAAVWRRVRRPRSTASTVPAA